MTSASPPAATSGTGPVDPPARSARHLTVISATAVIVWAVSVPRSLWGNAINPYLVVVAVGLVLLLTVRRPIRRWHLPPVPLAFGIVAASSLLWTTSRRDTALALAVYGALALSALIVHACSTRAEALLGLASGLMLIMITSLAALPFNGLRPLRAAGPGNTMTMFQGLYGHWNILSFTLCLLLPALAAVPARTTAARVGKALALMSALGMVVAARSASGIVTAVAVLVLWVAISVRAKRTEARSPRAGRTGRLSRIRTTAALTCGALLVATIAYAVPSLLQKDFTNLSGRVPLWHAIAYAAQFRAWEGYGFGAVWSYHWLETDGSSTRDLVNLLIPFPLAHGHNGLMDLVIQVGIVGVLAYVGIILRAGWRAGRWQRFAPDATATWALLTMFVVVALGMMEPLWMVPLGWFLVVLVACETDSAPLPMDWYGTPRHALPERDGNRRPVRGPWGP